jgi:hypothetical protein
MIVGFDTNKDNQNFLQLEILGEKDGGGMATHSSNVGQSLIFWTCYLIPRDQ